jgi:hypothetical protein
MNANDFERSGLGEINKRTSNQSGAAKQKAGFSCTNALPPVLFCTWGLKAIFYWFMDKVTFF